MSSLDALRARFAPREPGKEPPRELVVADLKAMAWVIQGEELPVSQMDVDLVLLHVSISVTDAAMRDASRNVRASLDLLGDRSYTFDLAIRTQHGTAVFREAWVHNVSHDIVARDRYITFSFHSWSMIEEDR